MIGTEKTIYEFALENMNLSYNQIAQVFDTSPSWVRAICLKNDKQHSLKKQAVINERAERFKASIREYVKNNPNSYIQDIIAEFKVDATFIYKTLKAENLALQKKKKVVKKRGRVTPKSPRPVQIGARVKNPDAIWAALSQQGVIPARVM